MKKKKNADYGNSFENSLNEFGTLPIVIRLNEKVNRLKSLCVGKQQIKDESIEDTLKDIANYCIITLKWLKNKKNLTNMKIDKKKFAITYTLDNTNCVFLDYCFAKSKKHAERNIKRRLGEFGIHIIEIKED